MEAGNPTDADRGDSDRPSAAAVSSATAGEAAVERTEVGDSAPTEPVPEFSGQPEPRPEGYDPSAFVPFAVTVDIVLLTVVERRLKVLLIQRGNPPYEGAWALPGGFVRPDEDLAAAAARELAEETGITEDRSRLHQLGAYGEPGRDPRMRVVTVAYLATVARLIQVLRAGSDAAHAELVPVAEVHAGRIRLAFDHLRILCDALGVLRSALEESLSLRKPATDQSGGGVPAPAAAPGRAGQGEQPGVEGRFTDTLGETLALGFSPPEFTIRELQEVYEAVLDSEIDPGNFQRAVRGRSGFIVPTEQRVEPGHRGGRPATRWRPAHPDP